MPIERSASFSRDGRYRYRLGRRWGTGPVLPWVLLNPSRADGHRDDPTIRRVMALSRSWGFDACAVVNLFAYRATEPRELAASTDPVGPGNQRAVATVLGRSAAGIVVVGWGSASVPGRDAAATQALQTIRRLGLRPVSVARNRDGTPRHPLYVPGTIGFDDHPSRNRLPHYSD